MSSKHLRLAVLPLSLALAVPGRPAAQVDQTPLFNVDQLRASFAQPPRGARPLVWWHWMNGNISKEGIRLDIEWMDRAGIAGYQLFDAARSTPQIVPERQVYMSPAWKDAFGYASRLATEHGLEQAVASSPGWSISGGPWVKPADGMKKYVWSETTIDGGRPFAGRLARPPSNAGPFQGRPVPGGVLPAAVPAPPPPFYVDTAVIAFREPEAATSPHARIDASDPALRADALQDDDYSTAARLAIPAAGEQAWIRYTYDRPATIRSISLATNDPLSLLTNLYGTPVPHLELEASDDGKAWRKVTDLPSRNMPVTTLSFSPVTARYYRVTFRSGKRGQPSGFFQGVDPASYGYIPEPRITHYEIGELALHGEYRLNGFASKAGFGADPTEPGPSMPLPPDQVVRRGDVVDVTAHMAADGTLRWTPPTGLWTILRFGYGLVGKTNHPAEFEATGLEVDKLDADAVRRYTGTYLDGYASIPGVRLGGSGLSHLVIDSWEAGVQNWTPALLAEFQARRGYDPRPWFPVLTGRVVDSVAASERFLWDFRATLGELVSENHFGVIQQALRRRGMDQYVESHEGGRAYIGDGMRAKEFSAAPMSAMWARDPATAWPRSSYSLDIHESASVAHIYGQKTVASESFTANTKPYGWSPAMLKKTADLEFIDGVNRIVVHSAVHQPLRDAKPGLTLGPFGQWFNRNETWAEQARPWTDYLARSSYLLQQGLFVADVLSFYGENTNVTRAAWANPPKVPAGYRYDYADPHTVMHALRVDAQGRIVTPSGMHYSVLDLGGQSRHMTVAMLEAVRKLVVDGATVIGRKPEATPTLADDEARFAALASELFGDADGVRRIGKGTVYVGQSIAAVLADRKLARDFDAGAGREAQGLAYVHRELGGGDLYFVSNQGMAEATVEASFRVAGREPELWHADTGKIEPVSYRVVDGRTLVPLRLAAADAVFVVFLRPATQAAKVVATPVQSVLATLGGPWHVRFPAGWGAPAGIDLPELASWSRHEDLGVRYFSGTATYDKTLMVPAGWLRAGTRVLLDLGDVKNLASVSLNGQDLGTVWHAPYEVDLTPALRAGPNTLAVSVTNAWVNRLIGDEQPGATKKYTFSTYRPYTAASPLLPSGLLGPVTIRSKQDPAEVPH
jgi:hypothetical protein